MGTILVVDRDTAFASGAATLLGSRGHRVVMASTSVTALDHQRAEPFDLVLVGQQLEDLDGARLVAQLRERDPDQALILAIEPGEPEGSELALQAGAADAVHKPLQEAELLLAVDRALERSLLRRERSRLLDENLSFAREQSLHQRCLDFLAHPDLEWLQDRVLADLASVCDAQSAALWLSDERSELQLRAYRGLLDRRAVPERISPADAALAGRLEAGAPWLAADSSVPVMFVPLLTSGEVIGVCQLSDPLAGAFRTEHIRGAKTLADFAAVGLKNARRFLALQRLGLRDRDTAAYNLSYFTDYASKEIYKARRYARMFSLLTFSIDNLTQARIRLGAAEARKATRGIIRALSRIIRDADIIAKASDQEFYMLLPETDYFGATIFSRRAAAAIREDTDVQEVESKLPLALVCGTATFPKDGEDFDVLVHTCRQRMEERRSSLQRKLMLEPLSFWEEVEVLLGGAQSPKLPVDERAEPSRRGKVSEALFFDLQREIARELLRDPQSRGVVYVGSAELHQDLPIAGGLEQAPPDIGTRVYALGRRGDLGAHPAVTPVYVEGDERLGRHDFILWLGETSAYAFLQRPGKGAHWGFHSSDTAVVDGLITRLQNAYDLQPY